VPVGRSQFRCPFYVQWESMNRTTLGSGGSILTPSDVSIPSPGVRYHLPAAESRSGHIGMSRNSVSNG
jgi:hypothetical protein